MVMLYLFFLITLYLSTFHRVAFAGHCLIINKKKTALFGTQSLFASLG